MKRTALLLALLALVSPASAQRVLFVNAAAVRTGDGTSWATAYRSLQDALGAARGGDELWVAAGTYRPDEGVGFTPGDRRVTFTLALPLTLLGGFCGDETRADAVVPGRCPSVLEGDLAGNDDDADSLRFSDPKRADNTILMLRVEGAGAPSRLSGFTIRHAVTAMITTRSISMDRLTFTRNITAFAANADGITVRLTRSLLFDNVSVGGGTRNHLVLDSVRVRKHSRGIALYGNGGSLVVSRSSFERVRGWYAIEGQSTHVRVYNTTFVGGASETADVVNVDQSDVLFANVLFAGNRGGALYYSEDPARNVGFPSRLRLVGVTSYGNVTGSAGTSLMLEDTRDVRVANAILYGGVLTDPPDGTNPLGLMGTEVGWIGGFPRTSATIGASIIAGGLPRFATDGGGVRDIDPRFVDPLGPDGLPGTADDDFRLAPGSPARDAGDATALPPDEPDLDGDGDTHEPLPVDLAGRPRVQGAGLDLGAFEADPSVAAEREGPAPSEALALAVLGHPARGGLRLRVTLAEAAPATVTLYDALGRRVARLHDGPLAAGATVLDLPASALPPGVYAVRVVAGHHAATALVTIAR